MDTMKAAHIRLELSSRAENVPVVRQTLAGLADATGLLPADLNDIGTATTEACNNASVHAYGGDQGPLEVEMLAADSTVTVSVRDYGVGMPLGSDMSADFPHQVNGDELTGIGVPSIIGLTSTAQWSEPAGGGTFVEMSFSTGPLLIAKSAEPARGPAQPLAIEPGRLPDTIEVRMAPLAVARGVLPRLLRALAARAHFSMERHADVQRVGSTLLTAASTWALGGCVQARLAVVGHDLELTVGPMAGNDAMWTTEAVRRAEPALEASMTQASGGEQWLVLRIGRSRR
jgi:serine/threonine-protein kinase RsbW